MSLNIKNEETVRLVRELAAATGESATGAVSVAVRERLARMQHRDDQEIEDRIRRIREIAEHASKRWNSELTSTNIADILYDEHGLPR